MFFEGETVKDHSHAVVNLESASALVDGGDDKCYLVIGDEKYEVHLPLREVLRLAKIEWVSVKPTNVGDGWESTLINTEGGIRAGISPKLDGLKPASNLREPTKY